MRSFFVYSISKGFFSVKFSKKNYSMKIAEKQREEISQSLEVGLAELRLEENGFQRLTLEGILQLRERDLP